MPPRSIVVSGLIVLLGCGASPQEDEDALEKRQPGTPTRIHATDGEFSGSAGLTLTVLDSGEQYELVVNGSSAEGEVWTLATKLDRAAIDAGKGTATVAAGPAMVGQVDLKRQFSMTSFIQATAGELSFQLAQGTITGVVTGAVPGAFNATFEGPLGVLCLVPKTGRSEGGGTVSEDGSLPLIPDEQLESPVCEPLRVWAASK